MREKMALALPGEKVRGASAMHCAAMGLLLALAGCGTPARDAPPPTVVVVRHAEKAEDGTRDPPLSTTGRARADAIAQRLAGEPLAAVFATEYRRTQMTAAPVAARHGLEVVVVPGATPASAVADRVRGSTGTVLVVGHSNTVPGIVSALCGCDVRPLGESDYDRWFELKPSADGGYALREARY